MKNKDFKVIKTEKQFLSNYSLHDIAKNNGEKIIEGLHYKINDFGEDRRYEQVWEAGEDKPDGIITDENGKNKCLIDWKGKKSEKFRVNKRAYNSYVKIAEETKLPVVIASAKIDNSEINSFKFIVLPDTNVIERENVEWDGNRTVIFKGEKIRDFSEIGDYLETLK